MNKRCSIWQSQGHLFAKILFCLSCILIYPIFLKKRYEKYTCDTIQTLDAYHNNLAHITKFRKNMIAVLYIKHHKQLPPIVEELSKSIIESEITLSNYHTIEIDIENVIDLLSDGKIYNREIYLEYNNALTFSKQEYDNILNAYGSLYGRLVFALKGKIPWTLFLAFYRIDELAITK